MTMKGETLGIRANGCRTELPVFIQFRFREEKILSEYFFFDLSEFCAQSGVSTDEMRRVFFPTNQQAESH